MGGLYGGEIRHFLRSQCAGGDLRITSSEGEITRLHSFFLMGNLPEVSLLVDRCHQCRDTSTEDITIIAPGNCGLDYRLTMFLAHLFLYDWTTG